MAKVPPVEVSPNMLLHHRPLPQLFIRGVCMDCHETFKTYLEAILHQDDLGHTVLRHWKEPRPC